MIALYALGLLAIGFGLVTLVAWWLLGGGS